MTMADRVLIIGGGFAGLAAGVRLAGAGYKVELLERRAYLGGRAYSFTDPTTGDSVDNGQHLFMGCYKGTIEFLERIGTVDRLNFQNVPRVDFVDQNGIYDTFRCPSLPPPFHALVGLFRLKGLSVSDKLRTLNVGLALKKNHNGSADALTVNQWLDGLRQSERIKRRFWYPLMIATLNEDPAIASATMMKVVLSKAFGSGRAGSRIGISSVGLSDLYTDAARSYVEARGGLVRTGAEVRQIVVSGDSVSSVELKTGESIGADFYVSAVPPGALAAMLPESLHPSGLSKLESSPIVSINLWFDRPVMEGDFVGILGTNVQWAFNKNAIHGKAGDKQHVAVVISAARRFVNWPRDELVGLAVSELRETMPGARGARLVHSTIVKEREATLSHTVDSDRLRPGTRTSISNFALAGDWINTGLPATIEGAVISGHQAADRAVEYLRRGSSE